MAFLTFGDNMLFSTAYAQTAGAAPGAAAGLESFLPLVLIFVVFYFLLIRPQQKRAKQHQETLGKLRRGDKIVIGGGIFGQVTKVISDTEVEVEIATGVKVKVLRSSIQDVLTKTEPVAETKDKEKDDHIDTESPAS
jgi:preprotein translocase subunit YajC